jgi:predicted enzyme related to lactoylglutathione lyase
MASQLPSGHKIVHLELKTGNLGRACSFYGGLLGWRPERISAGGLSYLALELGPELGGGVVEDERESALWLPYVEVDCVRETTSEAEARGARVALDVREGPGGWRSVIETPDGAEIAFWQRKR